MSFYDECDSPQELEHFLETASMQEMQELFDTISYHILHDDPCSPLWEYKIEIAEAIDSRFQLSEQDREWLANEKRMIRTVDEMILAYPGGAVGSNPTAPTLYK